MAPTAQNSRAIVWYWLLLLIPTLLIGGYALNLLRHESKRLERVAIDTATEKANLAADAIRLSVTGIKKSLLDELVDVAEVELEEELWAQEFENPFVRNGFMFRDSGKVQGLLMPNLKEQRGPEKIEFVRVYPVE